MWKEIKQVYSFGTDWLSFDLHACFHQWNDLVEDLKKFHVFICWEIWLHSNLIMFEGSSKFVHKVVSKIHMNFNEWHRESTHKAPRIISPPNIDNLILIGFFDGAAQENATKCLSGVVINIDQGQHIQIKWNCDRGTNTYGELLALWVLLWTAQLYRLTNL